MIDLNLLRVLAAVIDEKSVTGAASRLQVTQPAITQGLNRLRKLTQDELFIKAGRGVVPTRAAMQLYGETSHLVCAAELAVARVAHFDSLTTTAIFRIALTDIGQMGFLPVLIQSMRTQAPNASMEVISPNTATVVPQLLSGELDAAILSASLGDEVRSEVLHQGQYLCVSRRGLFPPPGPSLEELNRSPRVVLSGSTGHTLVEKELAPPSAGSVSLDTFSAIPALVSSTDLIAFVPEVLIRTWGKSWAVDAWPLSYLKTVTEVRAHLAKVPSSTPSAWFGELVVSELRDLYGTSTLESSI